MRKWNFCAGPAVISEEVLEEVKSELLEYNNSGTSIMEVSHRSKLYSSVAAEAKQDLIDILNIPKNYDVLFLQGGATHQFSMVPYNLVHPTCIAILLASCYTFSDKNMKTSDYYFKGFSALWNLLVFFLFILDLGLWFNFGAICLCLILTFIPIKIIHPFRVKELRNSSILMVGVWSVSAVFLILHKHSFLLHQFHAMIFGLWLMSTAYFVWISLRRSFKQNT